MMQPKHHQSTSIPWPYLRMISGAKYSGVPQIVVAFWSLFYNILESPKSVSFIYPVWSIIMFYGFKLNIFILYSLYTILCLCSSSKAKRIWAAKKRVLNIINFTYLKKVYLWRLVTQKVRLQGNIKVQNKVFFNLEKQKSFWLERGDWIELVFVFKS